jgi:hypothetical protein
VETYESQQFSIRSAAGRKTEQQKKMVGTYCTLNTTKQEMNNNHCKQLKTGLVILSQIQVRMLLQFRTLKNLKARKSLLRLKKTRTCYGHKTYISHRGVARQISTILKIVNFDILYCK